MGRASFGGAGDYSGLFASLYNQSESEAKRATEAAATRSKQALAAADDLAFSDWESGKISDDDLLAYIERRVSESAGDPTDSARWLKVQEQYRVQIADSKAESAYAAGGDLADLIQYYEAKMAGKQEDSGGYRVAQQRVIQLRDQAAEERFSNELNSLLERRASSKEVLDFYGKWKQLARPGSSLENKVDNAYTEKKSQNVLEDAETKMAKLQFDYTRGKISAAKYYNGIRDAASVYQTSDPVRYYQVLQSAFKTKQEGSGGGGGGSAVTSTLNSIIKLVDQWEAAQVNGSATMFNPLTGQVETITADQIRKYDNQFIKGATNMASAYKAGGNNGAAADIYNKIGSFIASHVQVHVGFEQTDRLSLLLSNGVSSMNNALDSNDVYAPEKVAKELQGQISTWAKGLSYKPLEPGETEAEPYGPRRLPTQELLDWAAQADIALGIFSNPAATDAQKSAAMDMLGNALSQNQNVDARLSSVIGDLSKVFVEQVLIPTGDVSKVTDALRTGKATEFYDAESGRVSVAFVQATSTTRGEKAPDGSVTMKPVIENILVDGSGNPVLQGGQIIADVLVDVNDSVKKMPVIISPANLPIYNAVYTGAGKKGKPVTQDDLNKATEADFLKGGKYQLVPPPIQAYSMLDSKTGKTWYYMPTINGQPGGWVEMEQLKFGSEATQIGGITIVAADKSGVVVPPFTKILPAVYIGSNPEGAQNILDKDPSLRGALVQVDGTGNIVPTADTSGVYYSPSSYGKIGTSPRDQINARDSWWNVETEEEIRRDKVRSYNNSIIQFRAGEREDLGISKPSGALPFGIGIGAGMPTLLDAAKAIGVSIPGQAPSGRGAPEPALGSEYAGINRAAALSAQAKTNALTPTIRPATVGSDYLINIANANAAKAKFTVPSSSSGRPGLAPGLGGSLPYATPATSTTRVETDAQRAARTKEEQLSLIQFRAGERNMK
jgi:hypothetical protein